MDRPSEAESGCPLHPSTMCERNRFEVVAVNLPIRFPNDADVIAEDAARFRALSDDGRVHALDECFRDYHFLLAASGRSEELTRYAEEEERQGRDAILEFVSRHG